MESTAQKIATQSCPSPDWIQINLDYRANVKTHCQIGKEKGITHDVVNNRARRNEWSGTVISKNKPVLVSEIGDEFDEQEFIYVFQFQQGRAPFYKVGMAKHLDSRLKAIAKWSLLV